MKLQFVTFSFLTLFSTQVLALQCGETVSGRVVMTEDLDCSGYAGYAALRLKDDAVLAGKGHKIISPNTQVGVYAEGNLIKVKDVEISGNENLIGVQGYNVVRFVLDNVTANDMYVGVDYYTETDYDCDRLKVVDSDLSRNAYGAKVISPNCEYSPRFLNTDFSDSKQFAMNLSAQKLNIREIQSNIYDRSARGLLLSAKNRILVEGLNLADAQIEGTQIYAYGAARFVGRELSLGNNSAEGINLYDIADVDIKDSEIVNSVYAIKVANDKVATDLKIARTTTSGSSALGLLVTSYGSTKFSNIDLTRNDDLDYVQISNQ